MIEPRVIRLRDAPRYLGMDKNRFNNEVRPQLISFRVGKQGIAFDRLDLDAWLMHYKEVSGIPALRSNVWGTKERQGLSKEVMSGISTKQSTESEFAKALELTGSKKQKNT